MFEQAEEFAEEVAQFAGYPYTHVVSKLKIKVNHIDLFLHQIFDIEI